jgi:hypothetical protein
MDLQQRDEYIQARLKQLGLGRQIRSYLGILWWRLISRIYH